MRRLIADAIGFGLAALSVFIVFALGVVTNENIKCEKKIEDLESENRELKAQIIDLKSN